MGAAFAAPFQDMEKENNQEVIKEDNYGRLVIDFFDIVTGTPKRLSLNQIKEFVNKPKAKPKPKAKAKDKVEPKPKVKVEAKPEGKKPKE